MSDESATLAAKVRGYAEQIEAFVAMQTPVEQFAGEFFRAFQSDDENWDDKLFDPLNAMATAAECYSPEDPLPKYEAFHFSEERLREECRQQLAKLRVAARELGL